MDPFHVVKLAGDALDEVRRRIQQETTGHRGQAKDPLYRARRTLHTDADLLTAKQQERIVGPFADANFTAVEVTWAVYQDIVSAYRTNNGNEGKKLFQSVIDDLTTNLPTGLVELKRLGQPLKRPATGVLASFTLPGTPKGPTEAINGRLEHLRGSELGSATSRITSRDVCSSPVASGRFYTLNYDEPYYRQNVGGLANLPAAM